MDATSAPVDPVYPAGYPASVVAGRAANLRLFIPGKPVPKGRPRSRVVNPKAGGKAFVQVYTDSATATWEETVVLIVKNQIPKIPVQGTEDIVLPFSGRVLLEMRFNLERPKSTPKSVAYPMKSRSDVDNLAKSVMDGLQKAGVLSNDNIVTDLSVQKRFADLDHPEGVEIDIMAINEQ